MQTPLHDLSAESMVQAIEANTSAFLVELGRAGGGEERDDATIHWVIGGSPIDYHNCVVRADLAPDTADEAIKASIACFQAHGVPGTWHVGPGMRPADLGQRLVAHGFVDAGWEPGMAADLRALSEELTVPPGLTVEEVRDKQGLTVWAQTLARGFGEGEVEAMWVREMYGKLGFGEGQPWHHYLARLHGAPVATSSLLLAAGVAGIYFVFTVPEARRQGIGAAITLAALRDARTLGYQAGVLG